MMLLRNVDRYIRMLHDIEGYIRNFYDDKGYVRMLNDAKFWNDGYLCTIDAFSKFKNFEIQEF